MPDQNTPYNESARKKCAGKHSSLNSSVLLGEDPVTLLILPVFQRPCFPGISLPITIDSGIQYDTLKRIATSEMKTIGILLSHEPMISCSIKTLYPIGVAGVISKILPSECKGFHAIVDLANRFRVISMTKEQDHFVAEVEFLKELPIIKNEVCKAYAIKIVQMVKKLVQLNPLFKEEMHLFLEKADINNPGRLADMAAALTTASAVELQEIVECIDIRIRLEKTVLLVGKELDLNKIQLEIDQQVEVALGKLQKEYVLREQLKTIKQELGLENDERHSEITKFEARLHNKNVPANVLKIIQEEMKRLGSLEQNTPDYGVCRNSLDWLTNVPWGVYFEQKVSLQKARTLLNREHWGVEEVKDRICEIIAVSSMLGNKMNGVVLCLVGPPGVGKTTIARSIAHALGRKFFKFSVGGMRDEAEIKGHRKTYVGSMPGKLIQALKFCQSMNPVILLDEVDKMVSNYLGDPTSSLLEVFDREQNYQFLDHYLDVPCDLSRVVFVLSANLLENLPDALQDRFEVIQLSGYATEEKIQIAKKHLIPKALSEVGLPVQAIRFSQAILKEIVSGYARESGVRNFEGQIQKICRKLVTQHVGSSKQSSFVPLEITLPMVKELLGLPKFQEDPLVSSPPVGVAVGLAWTALGGTPLCVETLVVPAARTAMRLTGQAGSVMKESSEIAWSFCQNWLLSQELPIPFFPKKEVHIHLPEGATPKDGPSAGITLVSALLSQLFQMPIKPDIAMTGELTLNGHVLPVGGIREKIAAAKRAGLKQIILPSKNKQDVKELPELLKKSLKLHFVSVYKEIVPLIFGQNWLSNVKKRTKKTE